MFVDLNELPLHTGERHERTYSLDIEPVILGGVAYQVLLPEGAIITVDRVVGGFLVGVSAKARVYGPCARCLNEAVVEVPAEQQEFAPTARAGWEDSDLSVFIEDLVVDVAGVTREAIVLALPEQLVCSPECKGLCPRCGQDLNLGECSCEAIEGDERWQKLRELELRDGQGP
ncbi:MAG: DUF177 domain-containing protein [Thermoleophilia bacterium]|nr:DUF177 domain-containing protein [Thermoleophilia bacterium]